MRMSLSALIWGVLAGTGFGQEKPATPWDAIEKHEKAIKAVPGFKEISVGGVNGETIIVIRVEGEKARDAVRAILGEKLGPYRVHLLMSPLVKRLPPPDGPARVEESESVNAPPKILRPTVAEERPIADERKGRPTQAAPRKSPEDDAMDKLRDDTQCDIVREVLKLPLRKGWSELNRCSWTRRTVIGPGNSHDPAAILRVIPTPPGATPWKQGMGAMGSIWWCDYPRHRADCPFILRKKLDWVTQERAPDTATPTVIGSGGTAEPLGPRKTPGSCPPPPYTDDPFSGSPGSGSGYARRLASSLAFPRP